MAAGVGGAAAFPALAFAATAPVLTADIPLSYRRSTYELMSPQTNAIRAEDTAT